MGKLAGIFYFDLRPVSPEDRDRVGRSLDGPEPAALEIYGAPGLLMAYAASPDSRRDRGAGCCSAGHRACTFDGRLDNRAELLARLDENRSRAPASAVALAIHEADGPAGLGRLVGDWSLAIWNARNRTVSLASDYAGTRPLYFHRTASRLIWSSSLKDIAEWARAGDLDEDYAAAFLSRGLAAHRTPYRGVLPVPAGSIVSVSPQRLETTKYWSLPVSRTIHYRDESQYEEQLRVLFQEAVAARLDTAAPVCAELSGGLDSSSVVSMAHRLIQGGKVRAPGLVSFSYRSAGSTDEQFYRAVEQSCNLPAVHLETGEYPATSPDFAAAAPLLWGPRLTEVARRMAAGGSRVFLTGQLGDLMMGNWLDDSEQAGDYLRQGRFSQAVREAFAWSHSLRVPVYSILGRALGVASSVNADMARNAAGHAAYGDSLSPGLSRIAALHERGLSAQDWLRHALPARRKRLKALHEVLQCRALQCPEPMQGVEYCHPFLHRPLVEFMLAIPPAAVCRPGEPRRLMRRAFAGIVPDLVLRRRSKGGYDAMFLNALRPCASELLRRPGEIGLVQLGYVDRRSVEFRLRRLVAGLECNESQLRHLILFEFWLRNREQAGSAADGRATAPAAA
ncbi:MAG: hypothetical protein LAP87_04630 [Acidobacteriia bacterium]|nr:hypothetical protein [Terriglobia bacterium]